MPGKKQRYNPRGLDTEGSILRGEEGEDLYTGAGHKERGCNPRGNEGSIARGEEGVDFHTGAGHKERGCNPRGTEDSIARGEEGEGYRTVV